MPRPQNKANAVFNKSEEKEGCTAISHRPVSAKLLALLNAIPSKKK